MVRQPCVLLAAFTTALLTVAVLPTANQARAMSIDISTRASSQQFYFDQYMPSEGVAIGWTGNNTNCHAGDTSAAHKNAMQRRVNYFRSMAGIPIEIQFDDEFNRLAQEAAALMSANNSLSHDPPTSWNCWSEDGHLGASKSNLYLGRVGVDSIDGYIEDPGSNNAAVGHRKWILHPTSTTMGTGDVAGPGARSTNALYVVGPNFWDPKPELRDEFIAWPPPGFVPEHLVYPRWHISIDDTQQDADLSGATVQVTRAGQVVPTTIESNGPGLGGRDQSLVWRVSDFGAPPSQDNTYTVQIDNVVIDGLAQQILYNVTAFDPFTTPDLEGDFNGDSQVTLADYHAWQATFGESVPPGTAADGNHDGAVNLADYTLWRTHYATSTAAIKTSPVPEPSSMVLLAVVVGLVVTRQMSSSCVEWLPALCIRQPFV